jgi:hypothetical protein
LENESVLKKFIPTTCFLLSIVFITFLTSCENTNDKASSLLDFAPNDASIFINSNSFENLSLAIEHNTLLNETSNYEQLKMLEQRLQILKHLKIDSEFLICLSKTNGDSLNFTFITKAKKGLLSLDSISNSTSETFTSKRHTITKTTINGQTLFGRMIDSVFIGSNVLSIVENSRPKKTMDPDLESIYNTSSKEKSVSVILNLKNEQIKPSFFNDDTLNQQQFSNYMLLDVDISQDNLVCNGITKAIDSTKSWINVFKNTVPQKNAIGKIVPNDAEYMLSFTYNNFKTFNNNLQKFRKNDSLVSSTIFDNSVEIGLIQLNNQQAVVLNSIDATLTQEELGSQDIIDTFRDIPIYNYDKPDIFQNTFSPLIQVESTSKCAVLDDFFVFSDSTAFLKNIISNYQNKTTLSESNEFKNMMLDLSDASSIFIYNNASTLNSTLNTNFAEELNLKIDGYKASSIQFIYDTDFAHVNAAFKTYKSRGAANSVSEELDITLDAELLSAPQLFTNHTNNQKDIVVQDINNNLYLISNQGKIFWKKQLDGKVLGNIEQMDIYKNGRLQLVFATPHRVYVIDRNGKDVGPFPLRFNDDITRPLSLFDYDNNKNYRLLITQGKSLLMYDRNGNLVKGFNFKNENNIISSQPKHFRIGKNDYIVFSQGNGLKILDRTGRERINVKGNITFSGNGIYLYNDNFTTTNDKGILIQVNQKGQLSNSNLNLGGEHFITSTSKTLITLSENHLTIKSHPVELDYGEYTPPQIFYINDKIYVTTTDLQAKKIYLFDSLGKPIANFPVYGNSAIAMDNIDKDNNLEVITKGDDNSIIVYKIN